METQDDFLSANKFYFGKDANRNQPAEVTTTGYFVVFVDINTWWSVIEPPFFDGIDWSRLYTSQQMPSATSLNTSSGSSIITLLFISKAAASSPDCYKLIQ